MEHHVEKQSRAATAPKKRQDALRHDEKVKDEPTEEKNTPAEEPRPPKTSNKTHQQTEQKN